MNGTVFCENYKLTYEAYKGEVAGFSVFRDNVEVSMDDVPDHIITQLLGAAERAIKELREG